MDAEDKITEYKSTTEGTNNECSEVSYTDNKINNATEQEDTTENVENTRNLSETLWINL